MGLLSRLYAAGYDWAAERFDRRRGTERHRRRLVEEATGEVLEIGVGPGKNLTLYRAASAVTALEPDEAMRERAARRAATAKVPARVVDGDAQRLPFPDESFDTVVASLVLCTVPDQGRALGEVRRVLRPGGSLRFYEHVRADDPGLARWQDRAQRPWGWVTRGCHPNRDTVAAIESAGLRVASLDRFDVPGLPRLVRAHVLGVAERA